MWRIFVNSRHFREEMVDLREKLLAAEANRLTGSKTYTINEISERLRSLIYNARGKNDRSPHL